MFRVENTAKKTERTCSLFSWELQGLGVFIKQVNSYFRNVRISKEKLTQKSKGTAGTNYAEGCPPMTEKDFVEVGSLRAFMGYSRHGIEVGPKEKTNSLPSLHL